MFPSHIRRDFDGKAHPFKSRKKQALQFRRGRKGSEADIKVIIIADTGGLGLADPAGWGYEGKTFHMGGKCFGKLDLAKIGKGAGHGVFTHPPVYQPGGHVLEDKWQCPYQHGSTAHDIAGHLSGHILDSDRFLQIQVNQVADFVEIVESQTRVKRR